MKCLIRILINSKVLFIIGLAFVLACTGNNNNATNELDISNSEKSQKEIIPANYIDTASVTEENVWVRDRPSDGEQTGKLGKGEKCYILERGKLDTIRGIQDYWYKIVSHGTKGWIFGSQLSIKISQLKAFEETLNYFLQAYNNKNVEELNDYVHPQYGISFGYVVCDTRTMQSKGYNDIMSFPDFISFDTLQNFSNEFPAITCRVPNHQPLPSYSGLGNWSGKGCFWNEIDNGQVKLVSTLDIYEFYFKAIESSWFLIRIEKIDCN